MKGILPIIQPLKYLQIICIKQIFYTKILILFIYVGTYENEPTLRWKCVTIQTIFNYKYFMVRQFAKLKLRKLAEVTLLYTICVNYSTIEYTSSSGIKDELNLNSMINH